MSAGVGFRIESLYAFLAVHGDGDEGVIAAKIGEVFMPLVAADAERLEQLRPYAAITAAKAGAPVVLARFERRVDLERIEP